MVGLDLGRMWFLYFRKFGSVFARPKRRLLDRKPS